MRASIAFLLSLLALPGLAQAQAPATVETHRVVETKAVFGRIEPRIRIPARARIGGTVVELTVSEGDLVEAGRPIARIVDEKLDLQLDAIDARLDALGSQLANAETELRRAEDLLARGATTVQRVDQQRTQVEVLANQIAGARADRSVVERQMSEGETLAPISGRVLSAPAATGAIVMPGEPVAVIGGGGFFLRLAVPERHARDLREGDAIAIETIAGEKQGRLEKIYPLIENGRVVADVAVADIDDAFVDARVLVRVPVGEREALFAPAAAVTTRHGLDFVRMAGPEDAQRVVTLGEAREIDGVPMVEILSGLAAGQEVATR